MPQYDENYYKKFIAQGKLNQLIETLLEDVGNYLATNPNAQIQRIYNSLIIQSGRLKGLEEIKILGIGDDRDNTKKGNQITHEVIRNIDHLPKDFFNFMNGDESSKKSSNTDLRHQIVEISSKTNFEYDAFFSFSSKNLEEAKEICDELRGYGLKVFFSDESLKGKVGESFSKAINHALENSRFFFLLSTKDAMESGYVKLEYETFHSQFYMRNQDERKFIILKGRDFSVDKVPYIYRILQFANSPKEILDTLIQNESFINEKNKEKEKQKEKEAAEIKKNQAELLEKERLEKEKKARAEKKKIEEEDKRKALLLKAAQEQEKQEKIRKEQEREKNRITKAEKAKKEKEAAEKRGAFIQKYGWKIGLALLSLVLMMFVYKKYDFSKGEDKPRKKDIPLVDINSQEQTEREKVKSKKPTKEIDYQDLIFKMQEALNKKGYKVGKPDGAIGASTRKAILAFQEKGNIADEKIFEALGIEVNLNAENISKWKNELETMRLMNEMYATHEMSKNSIIIEAIEKNMKLIPAGTFIMGCKEGRDRKCKDGEKPAHSVKIPSFKVNKYEVTQEEWKAVMGSAPGKLKFKGCDKCPVENVNWDDAQDFLKKLNQITGKKYRLPTEAEWEYAARGGEDYQYAGSNTLDEVAWYYKNSKEKTHIVGGKRPNGYGLYDMSGNVFEWCEDALHNDYNGAPTDGSAWMENSSSENNRMVRGGSWYSDGVNCRSSYRFTHSKYHRINYFGFRLVL